MEAFDASQVHPAFCPACRILSISAESAAVSACDALMFLPGNPRAVALLSQVPDARALVAENFLIALVDLDDDDSKEIVVRGSGNSACPNVDNGACATLVLQPRGKRMATLASQPMFRQLAATREKMALAIRWQFAGNS